MRAPIWVALVLLLGACAMRSSPDAEPTPDVPLVGTFLFFEDFETERRLWMHSGAEAGVSWLRLNAPVCGGAWAMQVGRPGQATFAGVRGEHLLTLRRPIPLGTSKRPHLTYDVRGEAVPPESAVLQPEARPVGGEWRPVGSPALGRYRMVRTRFADLTALAGAPIELRFRVTLTGATQPTRGLYLDMVQVIDPTGVER